MSGPMGQGRVTHTHGEEIFVNLLLTGGTVTTYSVTGLGAMTANQYADQDAIVLTGIAIKGRRLHIVSNTTTALLFTEDVAALGLLNTDTLAIEQRGKRPTVYTQFWAQKDEFMMNTPKHTVDRQNLTGGGLKPAATVILKTDFPGKTPLLLTDGRIPFYMFGDEACIGTADAVASSTLNGQTEIGALTIVVAGASSFANGQYIQIGATTNAEVRKIASGGTTTTLVLDYPLRKVHATAAAVITVVKPYAHTHQFLDQGVYFTLQGAYTEAVAKMLETHGNAIKSMEYKIVSGEQVKLTIEYDGMNSDSTGTQQTPQSKTLDTPFTYDKVNSGVAFSGGATYGMVREITMKITRDNEAIRYNTSLYGLGPARLQSAKIRFEIRLVIDVTDLSLYTLNANKTKTTTVSFSLIRTAATDLVAFTFTNVYIDEAPFPISPEAATIKVNVTMGAEDYSEVWTDCIPYHPMGVRT